MAAKPRTDRTCAVRIVERKHARCDLRQRNAAVNAGKILAEHHELIVNNLNIYHTFTKLERCL